jgi:uncharacterized DUF497 family protein
MDPFEWDDDKNLANIAKHGVSFDAVIGIFDAPMVETVDERFDYGECRTISVGATKGRVLVVVWTMRGETRRIISARIASRNERQAYHQKVGPSGDD